jgi:hypothetical protein
MIEVRRISEGGLASLKSEYELAAKDPSNIVTLVSEIPGDGAGFFSRSLMGTFGRTEIEVPRARNLI